MWNDVRGKALTFGPNVFFLHNPWSCQLKGHERISPQRCEKCFAEFPLHILALYGSTPYLLKNETVVQVSVKLGIILTCKPKCKGLFRSGRACKHHRTTQCKLANVKPRFSHFIYYAFNSIVHSCEISLRQLVATSHRLNKPVWKCVKRSWVYMFYFFFSCCPCMC